MQANLCISLAVLYQLARVTTYDFIKNTFYGQGTFVPPKETTKAVGFYTGTS